ncbi:MAG: hypothetical protein P8M05_01585 [Flavobacteriales bacterium]|nr:hypothetical protein [Flavobacteriales bacterium]
MFHPTVSNRLKEGNQTRSINAEFKLVSEGQKSEIHTNLIQDDGRIRSLQEIRLFVFLAVSCVLIGSVFMVSDYFSHINENATSLFSVSTDMMIDSNHK